MLGKLLEPGDRAFTLGPCRVIFRQGGDQAPDPVADLQREMGGDGTGQGADVLDSDLAGRVEQLGALGFAHHSAVTIRSYPQDVFGGHVHAEHGFGPAQSLDARRAGNRRRMAWALAINLGLLAAEAVGGIVTGSLALLADAGHLLSDCAAIALGLLAARVAGLPASERRTFGYQRTEVIAALVNGLGLVAIAVLIVVGAAGRFGDPPEIDAWPVIALGVIGLLGNLWAALVLARGEREDVNLEGVLRHSAADALGSTGVVAVGVVVAAGGSAAVDPVVSIAIAALIFASSWRLIREPFDVLMEAAPADLDMDALIASFGEVPDVREVHDLHVWTLTAGFWTLAAHVVVASGADRDLVRRRLEVMLSERFGIDHTTLQMEEQATAELLRVEDEPAEES